VIASKFRNRRYKDLTKAFINLRYCEAGDKQKNLAKGLSILGSVAT